jgi:hypothetical protein
MLSLLLLCVLPAAALAGDPAALQQAVAAAIAAGARSYTVAPGLYNFSALPAGAPSTLELVGATDFALVSGGAVEFVFPPHGGLTVLRSARVALAGPWTIDAWPPFTTQGVVSGGVRSGKWFNFTLTLDAGFELDPARFIPSRAIFFDAATRRFLHGQSLCVTSALAAAPLGGGAWAVAVTFSCNPTLSVPEGALCALTPTPGRPVVQIENSTAVAVSDLTSHAAAGFTLLELGGGGGHAYTRFRAVRRPGSTRLMVSGADVFHSTSVAAGATIEDSELSFAADDLFAVHCELGILWRRVNATAYYVIDTSAPPPGGYGLPQARPGEQLLLYNMSLAMQRVGAALLAGLAPVTNASLVAEAQQAAAHIKNVLHLSLRPFPVNLLLATLAPPGLPQLGDYGALVELASRCGAGTLVQASYLHDTNGGMRVKGSRATVQGCVVENAYGIRCLPELYWTQSVSSNITLADNVLRGCGCSANAPHAIEYDADIVGLVLRNNTVYPANCT